MKSVECHAVIDSPALAQRFGIRCAADSVFQRLIDRILGVFQFSKLHRLADLSRARTSTRDHIENFRRALEISVRLVHGDTSAVGERGQPLVVISNHPYGILDSVIALENLLTRRDDVLVLTNVMLSHVRLCTQHLLWVDPRPRCKGSPENVRSLLRAVRHVRRGGCLLFFPAGRCSHFQLDNGKWLIQDPPWHPHLARLISLTSAPVLPMYFQGRNSALFCVGGAFSESFRSLLLLRELLRRRGTSIHFAVGSVITSKTLLELPPAARMVILRNATYSLGRRGT
ncbi:hypothetical protein [Achromobacter insolitus]|uniref:hypothetical protein n=1 Tax=Achromobacter insolitus TaxID=217204 RepID=UPI003CC7580B